MAGTIENAYNSETTSGLLSTAAPRSAYIYPEPDMGPKVGSTWDAFVFQYWPESLEDTYNVEYGQRQVFGGSHPLFQWTGGSGRDITFTARFTAEVSDVYNFPSRLHLSSSARYSVNCKAAADRLRSFQLPSYGQQGAGARGGQQGGLNTLARPPRRLYLVLEGSGLGGGDNDEVLCILRSAPVTYEAWFPDGSPRIVEMALTFSECVQRAASGGSSIRFVDRSSRETYGKNHYRYRGTVIQNGGS